MIELTEAVTAALSSCFNPVTAVREAMGYTVEQLSVTSGLAISELAELESGADTDSTKLARLASAVGLPENTIFTS